MLLRISSTPTCMHPTWPHPGTFGLNLIQRHDS
jgi:hypothetical protein